MHEVERAGDFAMTEAAANIRRLFLDPKDTYSDAEAAEILGIKPPELKERMESGEVEGVRTCCGIIFSRKELISFVMDYWPQETIEAALGDDLAKGIPKLLRLADLEVRIPRFEILALERLAERDGKSVNAVLARELRDLVSAESDFLGRQIPGFTAALRWPQ
jgi:DNA-binding Lrp family transcriptional regulator